MVKGSIFMWIEEITPGETVTLIATFQQEKLEFTTTVQESYEKKHIIYIRKITIYHFITS